MSSQKPISSISQRSYESDTRDQDDSFSSTGSAGGRSRPRASTSTIPLSVAYGALPTVDPSSGARPVSPQQSKGRTASPSPAPTLIAPPSPVDSARQRYAALKDQKASELAHKQQQQLKQRQSNTPGGLNNLASLRDTTVGAATAIHSAGGVKALNAMYATGRQAPRMGGRPPTSKLAEPPQTVETVEQDDEEMDEDEEVQEAPKGGQKRPQTPVDLIMSGAAKVKYVVKDRQREQEPSAMEEDEDESYDYAEESNFVEQMEVDQDSFNKKKTKRKRDEDKAFKPGDEPEQGEEDMEDGEHDDLDLEDAASKKRKRAKNTADKKAYRPSSDDEYASDQEDDTPRKRRGKVKGPTRLPFPANADMTHKNARRKSTKKGRKSVGGGEDDESMELDPDETTVIEKPVSQKSKTPAPSVAQITPQPSSVTPVPAPVSKPAAQKPPRAPSTVIAPAASISRPRSAAATLAPPPEVRQRSKSPVIPIGEGHPAYAPFNLQPSMQRSDSTASATTVEKQLEEPAKSPEPASDQEVQEDEITQTPPWKGLMELLVNIFYYILIWPLILIFRILAPGFTYGRDLFSKWSGLWAPIVFWGISLLVVYGSLRGFSSWASYSSSLDPLSYDPVFAEAPPLEVAELSTRVAQLEERLRRALSELAAKENAPSQENRLVGDVDQLWKRMYRMEDEMRERKSTETTYGSTLDRLSSDLPALRSKMEKIGGGGQVSDDRLKRIDAALAETRQGSEVLRKELEETKSLVKHTDVFVEQTQTELRLIGKTAEQALAEAKRADKAAKSAGMSSSGGSVNVGIVDARLNQLGYNTILRTDHALFEYGSGIAPQFTSPQYDVFAPTKNKPRLSGMFGKSEPIGPDASAVIMPFLDPGHCWAFQGEKGSIGIRLHRFVFVDEVVLEAPPQAMLDQPETTPKQFDVWGYVESGNIAKQQEYQKAHPTPDGLTPPRNDPKFMYLGTFEYDNQGNAMQRFTLDPSPSEHKIDFGLLVFTFDSNYGGDYTCLYRIRVHGESSGNNLYDLRS